MAERKSIITKWLQYCMVCGKPREHLHHALYGSKHKLADEDSLLIPLCQYHHQDSKNGVHFNRGMVAFSQALAQACWEKYYLAQKLSECDELGHQSAEDWLEEAAISFKDRYGEYYM